MKVEFEKWHGCLNDFILIQLSSAQIETLLPYLQRQAKSLCCRHEGIGADGIIILEYDRCSRNTQRRLVIINANGTLAQNCGNGLRCAALCYYASTVDQSKIATANIPEALTLKMGDSTYQCCFWPTKKLSEPPFVTVNMGQPLINEANSWHNQAVSKVNSLSTQENLPTLLDVGTCTIGNAHLILSAKDWSEKNITLLGRELESSILSDGLNIHMITSTEVTKAQKTFAQQMCQEPPVAAVRMHSWERGVGRTKACASGGAAVCAFLLLDPFLSRDSWIAITNDGGHLLGCQKDESSQVTIAGNARLTFTGAIEL